MKNFLTNLMTAAALLCTLGGALEAQSYQVTAKVPFEWQANGHHFSAGNYVIAKEQSSPVIAMRDVDDGKGAFLMISEATGKNSQPRLVFHRYGNQYFLAEVWTPGAIGWRLHFSSAERETIASKNSPRAETVLVAVN
jgi:hypothetical protein